FTCVVLLCLFYLAVCYNKTSILFPYTTLFRSFKNKEEAITAYHNGHVHLHRPVAVQASSLNNQTFTEEQNSKLIVTTVGKLLFNEIIQTTFPYINEPTINKLEEETPNGYFLEMGEDIVINIKALQIVST